VKIFVLVKQVPNTTQVKLDPKTGNLIREGVEAILNPEDRNALAAAIAIKPRRPDTVVTALTMGPPQAIDVLTEALGCGASNGVLLTDRLFAGADTWATSSVLARAIERLGGADLVLAGRQAIDGDTAQIGPQVAEALGIGQATYVCAIDLDALTDDSITVTRKLEAGLERLRLALPALLTVVAEVAPPRHPDLGRLLAACEPRAQIKELNAADLGFKADQVGLAGSLTHVLKTFSPKQGRTTERLAGSPAEMAAALVARLTAARVLTRGGGA
jgi:electron transfer flavoprotein beta subunit